MSLIDALDGALLTVVDSDARVLYASFGGAGVNIYDEHGTEVDYFSIGGSSKLTAARVRAVIERVRTSHD